MQKTFIREGVERISPPEQFVEQANVADADIYREFEENWPECWERIADLLEWERECESLVERTEDPPYRRWFVGGRLNAAENCIDRHVREGRGDVPALRWIGTDGETRTYTYGSLRTEVNEVAALLRGVGVEASDPVALYLPRLPELPITMLACARIGAPHIVVSAEYSGEVLESFMRETEARAIVTCDRYERTTDNAPLAERAQQATRGLDGDTTAVVIDRSDRNGGLDYGLDYAALREQHRGETVTPATRASDDPLFICYASGPSGEPVGMKHGIGGYLSYVAWTAHAVLDVKARDTVWCPATMEWITGHSYAVYGPLSLGATTVFYEGAPASSGRHRPWEIIERNDVTQFYSTPTAIRTFMDWGAEYPDSHDLSSLRLLGTVGQRIDPAAWMWFYQNVGNETCPIVDTWYQAETGGIAISTLPGVCDMKPGAVGTPLPGIEAAVVDADGSEVPRGGSGYLVLTRPSPGFFEPVGDPKREIEEYWTGFSDAEGDWVYFSEDGAVVDDDGYIRVLGRLDDVINVGYDSKTRVHVSEIERIIEGIDGVDDAAVVRGQHDIKGEAPYAFVTTNDEAVGTLHSRITDSVGQDLAVHACPEEIYTVPELPRTYSGSVLRKVLEDLLNGDRLGNTDLLRNPEILDRIAVEVRHHSCSVGGC